MSKYLERLERLIKSSNMSDELKQACDSTIKLIVDELNSKRAGRILKDNLVEKMCQDQDKKIAQLENDFFKQVYCASVNGTRANLNSMSKIDQGYTAVSSELVRNIAFADAQEAVRQVSELNKPKCKHEKGWEGPEGGPVYCIICDEKRELADGS